MVSKKSPQPATNNPEAVRIKQIRDWIAAAELEGDAALDMLLRLTSRDASALKRHPHVAVHEVTFAKGEMRFLGVKIEEGGVAASVLERNAV